jgi:hypothetical protein
MKNIVLALLVLVLTSSCSKQRAPKQTYDNPDIGLQLTYPGSWQIIKEDKLNDAIAVAEAKMPISQETVGSAKQLARSVILTLAKPRTVDGVNCNPNINVLVIPIREEEWKDIDLDTLLQEQITDIQASLPGAKVTPSAFP